MEYDESQLPPDCRLHDNVFHELAVSCPTGAVFPSLLSAKLVWRDEDSRGRFTILFLRGSLRRLWVDCDANTLGHFLGSVPKVANNLESFHLICPDNIATTEEGVLALIHGLPSLNHIALPCHLFSSKVFDSLSTHPRIESIHQHFTNVTNARIEGLDYSLKFTAGGFERLKIFRMDTDLSTLIDWLQSEPIPPLLRALHVHLRTMESKVQIRTCFVLLSRSLPDLVEFTFDLYTHNKTPSGNVADIAGDTFGPLSALKSLSSFVFDHPDPLSLSDDEVGNMAKAWPKLINFSLGISATDAEGQSILTLGVLVTFAERYPDLKSLALTINTSLSPSREPTGAELFRSYFFEINVGCSPIHDSRAVTIFLCQVFPESGALTFWDEETSTAAGAEHQSILATRQEFWREAQVWLKPLIRARVRQEEKMKQAVASVASDLDNVKQENERLRRMMGSNMSYAHAPDSIA